MDKPTTIVVDGERITFTPLEHGAFRITPERLYLPQLQKALTKMLDKVGRARERARLKEVKRKAIEKARAKAKPRGKRTPRAPRSIPQIEMFQP